MRRLAIFTSLPEVGGHTTTTIGLCKLLRSNFDEIEILCKTMPDWGLSLSAIAQLEAMNCRVTLLGDTSGGVSKIALIKVVYRYLIKPASVFLTIGMGNLSPVLAVAVRNKLSIYYHITHDLKDETVKRLALLSKTFDKILFISPITYYDYMAKRGASQKFDWCLQGSDLDITPSPRTDTRADRIIRFGLMGRLTKQKGAQEILSFIDADSCDCEVHVAGIGECANEFKNRAESQNVRSRVRVFFHGSFSAGDRLPFLRSFFEKIDWLCIPTIDDWESIAMVLLESLQHGVPGLITRTGGLKSFELPELGPPPASVVCRVQLAEFRPEMMRIARDRSLSDPTECVTYYKKFFATTVVASQWERILISGRARSVE